MADRRRNLGIPSGVVFPFAGTSAPYGYLVCDGSAISRSEYSALFATLGTSHGQGDGSTTFNLPDYRGRFMRGVDGTAGNDPDKASRTAIAVGGNAGNAVGSVQEHANESHSHRHYRGGDQGSGQYPATGFVATLFTDRTTSNTYAQTTSGGININEPTGGNESRPKNVNVNYIIKV